MFTYVIIFLAVIFCGWAIVRMHSTPGDPEADPQKEAFDAFISRSQALGISRIGDVTARAHLCGGIDLEMRTSGLYESNYRCRRCELNLYGLYEIVEADNDTRLARWVEQGVICVGCGICRKKTCAGEEGLFGPLSSGTNIFDILDGLADERGLPADAHAREKLAEIESRLESMRGRLHARIRKTAHETGEGLPAEPYRGNVA